MAPSAVSEPAPTETLAVTKQQPAEKVEKEVTPLEAISHGDVLPNIPTFPSYTAERKHILVHMAAVFRNWSRMGYAEGQSGHISVRDPEFPQIMWMNPLSRHYGTLTAGDMIPMEIDTGRIVGGNPNPATGKITSNKAGYYIHSAVHKRRSDIHAICHAHTPAGRAWSVFAKPLEMITQDVCSLYNCHAVYSDYGGIVFASDEGERIADALGQHNKGAILMNHGLLSVGYTVDEAGFVFGLMERSCAIQLQVEAACANGLKKRYISDEEAAYNCKMASENHAMYREMQPDVELEFEAAGGEEVLARGFDSLNASISLS
ncbi:hypothetical protein FJTKL_11137 [Diaporthe vaccinii]|uniref:Class II aldolase/adducin N-terminal domain-containing protein n=1 Tax=Diaporthe vaccinii TaxID=105482 RepID=A0ABR4EI04_9PEZI